MTIENKLTKIYKDGILFFDSFGVQQDKVFFWQPRFAGFSVGLDGGFQGSLVFIFSQKPNAMGSKYWRNAKPLSSPLALLYLCPVPQKLNDGQLHPPGNNSGSFGVCLEGEGPFNEEKQILDWKGVRILSYHFQDS